MSFEARDNIIRVTDTNGDVVFDTGTPMPHIAAVLGSVRQGGVISQMA
jgi:hypothetical protein